MRVEADEAYQAWNTAPMAAPARSELYCLAPIGAGSAQVEGLASYLMRLAEAHHVELGVLVDLVGAYLPVPCRNRTLALRVERLCERWREMANIEVTLWDWVWATEKLTLRTDIGLLTMLEWAEMIDLRSVYRYQRTWCPSCYEEWASAGQPIYEPLLWNIQEVKICPRHLRLLRQECNHCHRSQCAVLRSSRVGYCAQCGAWLGASEGEDALPEELDLERQRWRAINIGELASASAGAPRRLNRQQLAARLRAAEKSNPRLFFKWSIDEMRVYLNGQRPPSLAFLLELCWELEIGLSGFLTSGETR
jgi:ribosomal protein S27E